MALKTYEAFTAPSPYDQERMRAERLRRYAELLQQQSMEPEGEFTYQGIRAMPSPAAALGKMLQAYQSKKALEKAEQAEAKQAGMEQEASNQIMGRLMGGRTPGTMADLQEVTPAGKIGPAAPEDLTEVQLESQYTRSPQDAMRMAMSPQGLGAMRRNPLLAAALQKSMETPAAEEFYAPTETEGGLVQFGKRGGRKDTGVKAAPKAATPTELARLIAERDALLPNDPRIPTYDAAIKAETQGRGTTVNMPPSARDLQQDESRLRDQLEGRLNKMDWAGTQSAMQRILSAPDTPIGDVDIVYAAAKAADSSGAVRKEDFDLRAKDGSLGGQIKSWYEEAKSGRMLPARRQQIVDSAIQFYRARETSVNKLLKDYEGIASRSGLNVQNVIEPFKPIPLWSDDDEKRLRELREKAAQSGGKPQ